MDGQPPLGLVERQDSAHVSAARDGDRRWHGSRGRAVGVAKALVLRGSDGKVVTDHRLGHPGLRRDGLGRDAATVHLRPLRMRRCVLGLHHQPATPGTGFTVTP